MDIYAIDKQPAAGDFVPAYQPVQFRVIADAVVPVDQPMYCDIYFQTAAIGTLQFYRTLTAYTYETTQVTIVGVPTLLSIYTFDIQDALQEYLTTAAIANNITTATQVSDFLSSNNAAKVVCKFRGSTISGGLLTPNPTIPVQGTATTNPSSGTGTASNTFIAVKASLKPLDNRKYITHLTNKRVIGSGGTYPIYPLSNFTKIATSAPNLSAALTAYQNVFSVFPILISGLSGSCKVELITYTATGVSTVAVHQDLTVDPTLADGVWYVPTGIANILADQPTFEAVLYAPTAVYYRMLLNSTTHDYWVSPLYKIERTAIDAVSLFFVNFHGVYEQVTFIRNEQEHKVTSNNAFRGIRTTAYDVASTNRIDTNTGHRRLGIRSADEMSATITLAEANVPWFKELLSSPQAFMQVVDPESALQATAGGVGMLPVEILDSSYTTKRSLEDRYDYIFTVKFRPVQDYINLRN